MSILKLIAVWFGALPTYLEARHNPHLANHLMRDEKAKKGYRLMEVSFAIFWFVVVLGLYMLNALLSA